MYCFWELNFFLKRFNFFILCFLFLIKLWLSNPWIPCIFTNFDADTTQTILEKTKTKWKYKYIQLTLEVTRPIGHVLYYSQRDRKRRAHGTQINCPFRIEPPVWGGGNAIKMPLNTTGTILSPICRRFIPREFRTGNFNNATTFPPIYVSDTLRRLMHLNLKQDFDPKQCPLK